MSTVETVRGPVDTEGLGRTYVHEHIFILTSDVQQNYPEEWGDEDARVTDAVMKLTALADSGVRTIVDPTVVGIGRYIPRIQRVANLVPQLNVIVATGCYTYRDVPFFFTYRGPAPDPRGDGLLDPLVDFFVRDLEVGIADTGVKAALLKCAVDEPGLTPGVERILRAVAHAHRLTDAPVMVHTHPGSHQGLAVQHVLRDEGVDAGRVILAHSGDSTDADHLSALAEAGFWLGMDRFGINAVVTFEQRCDVVVELCRRGFAERLMLSHDAACYIDWLAPSVRAHMPQWHYQHIENDVLPYLRAHAVSEAQITTMLVENPRRYFEAR